MQFFFVELNDKSFLQCKQIALIARSIAHDQGWPSGIRRNILTLFSGRWFSGAQDQSSPTFLMEKYIRTAIWFDQSFRWLARACWREMLRIDYAVVRSQHLPVLASTTWTVTEDTWSNCTLRNSESKARWTRKDEMSGKRTVVDVPVVGFGKQVQNLTRKTWDDGHMHHRASLETGAKQALSNRIKAPDESDWTFPGTPMPIIHTVTHTIFKAANLISPPPSRLARARRPFAQQGVMTFY